VTLKVFEAGVSDALGAVLLVAIVGVAAAIIAAAVASHPLPLKTPALSADVVTAGTSIQLRHTGGDPVERSSLRILVDGADKTGSFTIGGSSTWQVWSIGDTLTYAVPAGGVMPSGIQLVYTGGSSGQVIQSWGASALVTSPVPPGTTIPVPAAPVKASFSRFPATGTVPLTVQFTDGSTGPVASWSWTFGDGTSSALQSPTHTYTDTGWRTVTLTVTNSSGGSDTATWTDCVKVTLRADFSASNTSGAAPLVVRFTDTSYRDPTTWSWTFGDGGTSAEQNPLHVYASAGTYAVTLTAANADGSNTLTRAGYITVSAVRPSAGFTASPLSGTAPLTVAFTDTSTNNPVSWSWDFGDGDSTNATQKNPIHRYADAGTYSVDLTASNSAGSDTATAANYISVTPPVSAGFTYTKAWFFGWWVTFTDSSTGNPLPNSWYWTFGDGGISYEENPVHYYVYGGDYSVTLRVSNAAGSSDTITKTISL
jgi:PKD repeat protein